MPGESPRIRAVRAFYEAWLSRDLDFAAELSHPDLEIRLQRYLSPEGQSSFHGREGIQSLWEALPELRIEEFRVEVCEVHEHHDVVSSQTDLRHDVEGDQELSGRVTGTWRFEAAKIRFLDVRLLCPEALNAGGPD